MFLSILSIVSLYTLVASEDSAPSIKCSGFVSSYRLEPQCAPNGTSMVRKGHHPSDTKESSFSERPSSPKRIRQHYSGLALPLGPVALKELSFKGGQEKSDTHKVPPGRIVLQPQPRVVSLRDRLVVGGSAQSHASQVCGQDCTGANSGWTQKFAIPRASGNTFVYMWPQLHCQTKLAFQKSNIPLLCPKAAKKGSSVLFAVTEETAANKPPVSTFMVKAVEQTNESAYFSDERILQIPRECSSLLLKEHASFDFEGLRAVWQSGRGSLFGKVFSSKTTPLVIQGVPLNDDGSICAIIVRVAIPRMEDFFIKHAKTINCLQKHYNASGVQISAMIGPFTVDDPLSATLGQYQVSETSQHDLCILEYQGMYQSYPRSIPILPYAFLGISTESTFRSFCFHEPRGEIRQAFSKPFTSMMLPHPSIVFRCIKRSKK